MLRSELAELQAQLHASGPTPTDPEELEKRNDLKSKINFLTFKLETEASKEPRQRQPSGLFGTRNIGQDILRRLTIASEANERLEK